MIFQVFYDPVTSYVRGMISPPMKGEQASPSIQVESASRAELFQGLPIDQWSVADGKLVPKPEALVALRAVVCTDIDDGTARLIAAGFTFQGKQFSLSANAQSKLLGMDQLRDALTYPIVFNNIDDSDVITLPDANTVHQMALAALATVRAALDSGTALKNQVRAAEDLTAVRAVVDTRPGATLPPPPPPPPIPEASLIS